LSTTPQQVEAIVIRAGIDGLAAARDLATEGYDSLVFEERNFTASISQSPKRRTA
jgi:glycerol-3-phosphate dehydrogenase